MDALGDFSTVDYIAIVTPFALYFLFKSLGGGKSGFTNEWFLINGVVIHFFLDV